MAKNINIGGRLHSVAVGNVVAGANEIYDDGKKKKQSQINDEVDAALVDLQTQVSNAGKVDDVKVNGVSVLNSENKEASINITASVAANDTPGNPTATATMQGGNIDVRFAHVKGETGKQGIQGIQGPQGDSVLVGQGDMPLAHTLGQDNTKAMSQKGVTDVVTNYTTTKMLDMELSQGMYSTDLEHVKTPASSRHIILPVEILESVKTIAGKPNSTIPAVIYINGEEPVINTEEEPATTNKVGEQYAEGDTLSSSIAKFNSPLVIPQGATHAIINLRTDMGHPEENAEITFKKNTKDIALENLARLNDLGYTYLGIATQTTVPSNVVKTFYVAKEQGTYEYFGGIQVRNGLTILKYDGEWTSEELYAVSSFLTQGSKDLAEAGTIFDELNMFSFKSIPYKGFQAGVWSIVDSDSQDSVGGKALSCSGKNRYIIVRVDNLASVVTVAGRQGVSNIPAIIYLNSDIPKIANMVGTPQYAEGTQIKSNGIFDSPLHIPQGATHAIINIILNLGQKYYTNVGITFRKSIKDTVSEIAPYLDIPTDTTNVNTHGIIGKYYPEQMDDIEQVLSAKDAKDKTLHFLHISDNHQYDFGNAEDFLDNCPAKFLVNTGDMVADGFWQSTSAETLTLALSPEKPVYLVPGNHDYHSAPSKEYVFNAFISATNEHNNAEFDKSYYSIDYTTEKVKCIMLDMNDGWPDAGLSSLSTQELTWGKMSQEQILWFAAQLKDAASKNLHVCVFIHAIPSNENDVYDKYIDSFFSGNYTKNSCCKNLSFLADIVDAFMNGGVEGEDVVEEAPNEGDEETDDVVIDDGGQQSVDNDATVVSKGCAVFTYNKHNYNIKFPIKGHFVGWFAGHRHKDAAGWLTGHERQFAINICCPNENRGGDIYDGNKLGVHFNYVSVDTVQKILAVYRVGQQKTVWATERKSFRVYY